MSRRENGPVIEASAGVGAEGSYGSDVKVVVHMTECSGCYVSQPVVNVTNHVTITNSTSSDVHNDVRESEETNNPSLRDVASFASALIGLLGTL